MRWNWKSSNVATCWPRPLKLNQKKWLPNQKVILLFFFTWKQQNALQWITNTRKHPERIQQNKTQTVYNNKFIKTEASKGNRYHFWQHYTCVSVYETGFCQSWQWFRLLWLLTRMLLLQGVYPSTNQLIRFKKFGISLTKTLLPRY